MTNAEEEFLTAISNIAKHKNLPKMILGITITVGEWHTELRWFTAKEQDVAKDTRRFFPNSASIVIMKLFVIRCRRLYL